MGMTDVLRRRNPLQVVHHVVRRIPVYVVDLRADRREVVWNEGKADHAMKKLGPTLLAFPDVDEPVSTCGSLARGQVLRCWSLETQDPTVCCNGVAGEHRQDAEDAALVEKFSDG